MMTVFKQNLLATMLLASALSLSLLMSYWLTYNDSGHVDKPTAQNILKIEKFNKMNHSLILLLPAIR
ncbi:hypothetical protein [Marinicella gelatinilytica]|uniref:hypothetical protein n=1 Tax=Marinicella gelatinilytica TaxID=2996017 RepID=UPI002260BEB9|nr:hypothetical protein [Marinicella gelatinilytica]MCX7544450.1 hypothetical protein [Marinicella gelatinilytica]